MRTGSDPTPVLAPVGTGAPPAVAEPVTAPGARRADRRRRIVAAAVLAALLVAPAACAQPDGGDPSGSPTGSPTSPAAPPGTPSPPPPTIPPGEVTPPPGARIQTVTGKVVDGVERHCLLLRPLDRPTPSGGGLLLVAAPGTLRAGTTVTVRGYADRDLLTYCQQGTPFVVLEVLDEEGGG